MDAARFPAIASEALDGTPFIAPRDFAAVAHTMAFIVFASALPALAIALAFSRSAIACG